MYRYRYSNSSFNGMVILSLLITPAIAGGGVLLVFSRLSVALAPLLNLPVG